jgi:hypothetical protein
MKKISREIADQLIQKSKPAKSRIEQSGHELCVSFNLTNGMLLLVKYNRNNLRKSYYLRKN